LAQIGPPTGGYPISTMATTTITTPRLITGRSTLWRPTIFQATIRALQPTAFGAGAAGRGSQLVLAPAVLKENSLALVSETHHACLSALARGELSTVDTADVRFWVHLRTLTTIKRMSASLLKEDIRWRPPHVG
jgi:hypothetical protein